MSKVSAFQFSLTFPELFFVLFKKKRCPKCQSKLTKTLNKQIVNGADIATVSTPLYISGRQVNQYYYQYACPNCQASYSLADLMNNAAQPTRCEPNGFIAHTAQNGIKVTQHYAEDIFVQEE